MSWSVQRLAGGLGEHAAAWDALNERLFGGHPMLTSVFVDGLLRHFPDPQAHLCTLRDAGGVQAMCILKPARMGQWTSYLPSQAQVGPSLLRAPLDLQALVRSLPGWVLQLDLLCVDPRFSDPMLCAGPHALPASHALTMAVDLHGGFDAYWATRSKKLRDNLRRYERRAVDDGLAPRRAVYRDAADMPAAVQRYATLESEGWKGRSGTALSAESGQLAFYTDVMLAHAGRDSARVYELWFGDTLAASRLVIAGGGMVVALKTCYSEEHKRYAPGRLMLRDALREAFETWPGSVFEFYTNATIDQLTWSTSQRQIVHVTAFRNAPARHLLDLRQRARSMRNTPAPAGEAEVQVFQRMADCPPDVLQLFAKAEAERVGFGEDWYAHFIASVLPADAGVRIYVLRRRGEPVAALPVLFEPAAGHVTALGNFYTTLYSPALEPGLDNIALVPLLRAACREHGKVPVLQFGPMDPLSPAYAALRASLRAAGLATYDYFCHGNWYLPGNHTWAEYLQQREGSLRSTIRRMEKKLQADGARIEILSDAADVERGIAAFQQVYAKSWKRPEPFPDFVPGLARLCARRGWLRLGVVWHQDTAIAAQFWIVAHQRAEIYKLAYDENFKALAPGTVLTAHMLQHVFERDRVDEVDYLIGDDKYKAQWMTHRRERWGLVAYDRRTAAGLAGWLKESLGRRFKRWRGRRSPDIAHAEP